ncbi:unnamed protein product [Linum trigynum]|uniref:Uncharacterized protein n=1 Tax=Linum trigynum TaxID=586398 RepID=A0AAV2CSW5_9ROSI
MQHIEGIASRSTDKHHFDRHSHWHPHSSHSGTYEGHSTGFEESPLRSIRFLGSFGPFWFIEGLPLPLEVPPLEQPLARAPGRRRGPVLQRPAPPPPPPAPPTSDPLVQRIYRLETHVVGLTS